MESLLLAHRGWLPRFRSFDISPPHGHARRTQAGVEHGPARAGIFTVRIV